MSERKTHSGLGPVILVTASCMLLFMLNNGIRSNFGLISSAVSRYTGLADGTISLAVAIAQLLYGLSQPFFGLLAMKKSNSFVLGLGGVLMAAGLLLIPLSRSALLLVLSLGLLVGLAAGALAFGVVMGAAAPAIGKKYAAAASGIINGAGGLGGAILAPSCREWTTAAGSLRAWWPWPARRAVWCWYAYGWERRSAAAPRIQKQTRQPPQPGRCCERPLAAASLCTWRWRFLPAVSLWRSSRPISTPS